MKYRRLLCAAGALSLAACGTISTVSPLSVPPSSGEAESGYTYVPLDPFPVTAVPGANCTGRAITGDLLDALPDNAVRMLVEKFDSQGNVILGPSKASSGLGTYRVTVDYINADTINFPVWIRKLVRESGSQQYRVASNFLSTAAGGEAGSELYEVSSMPPQNQEQALGAAEFNIPVYVGVGMRVSANVTVLSGDANISGIGVIGAEAEANRLRGSLIVQTLGVNGKSVAAALPIQNELNRTTAQNAIVAVASIKASLYSPETVKSPRVVGLYLPFPGSKPLVNALISELSKSKPHWPRPCPATGNQVRQPA